MNNLTKRMLLWSILGLVFGLICFAGFVANPDVAEEAKIFQVWAIDNAMMWTTVLNRFMLWVTVAMAWFITLHPIFKFKVHPAYRWAKMWLLVSLLMATWVLIWEPDSTAWTAFWFILIAWTVIWAIIDVILTKYTWEWEDLIVRK